MKIEVFTTNRISELSGKDRRWVKKALRDIPATKTKAGTGYHLSVWVPALIRASDAASASDSPELKAERLKKLCADRELAELDLGERRGELIPMDDAVFAWSEVAYLTRARFLRLVQIAPDLEGRTTAQISTRLESEVRKVLEELAVTDPAEIADRIQNKPHRKAP